MVKIAKLTHIEFEYKIKNNFKGNILVLGKYVNTKTKIEVECKKCSYIWLSNPYTLLKGHGCPKCAGNLKKTKEDVEKEICSLVGNEYSIIGDYVNTHTKVLFRHNSCGNEFLMSPKAFITQRQRCPNERYKKSSNTNSEKQGKPTIKNALLKDICTKENYEIIKGYNRASEKLELLHKECGEILRIRPYSFIELGNRCRCKSRSKGEEVINSWLTTNNFIFKEQYTFDKCRGKEKKLPFDFAVFDKNNNLLFLIEYDGTQHFSAKFGEESFKAQQKNDDLKNTFCKDNNISLIRIKYNNYKIYDKFKNKVISDLIKAIKDINMTIPSQAS